MLMLGLSTVFFGKSEINFPRKLTIIILFVQSVCIASIFSNNVNITPASKYVYVISRPFIIIFYLSVFKPSIERFFATIIKLSRYLILLNLPVILFRIVYHNVLILERNDLVRGFFPFNNNDTLVMLYTIVLVKDFYSFFIQKRRSKRWVFIFDYFLLLSSFNFKYILILTAIFGFILFIKSDHMVKNMFTMSIILIYPVIFFSPIDLATKKWTV